MPNNIARQVLGVRVGETDTKEYIPPVSKGDLISYDDALSLTPENEIYFERLITAQEIIDSTQFNPLVLFSFPTDNQSKYISIKKIILESGNASVNFSPAANDFMTFECLGRTFNVDGSFFSDTSIKNVVCMVSDAIYDNANGFPVNYGSSLDSIDVLTVRMFAGQIGMVFGPSNATRNVLAKIWLEKHEFNY